MKARPDGRGLRVAVMAVMLGGFVLPILAGLAVTAGAAFGHLPALGQAGYSVAPWRQLGELPGVWRSLMLSILTGVGATAARTVSRYWIRVASGSSRRNAIVARCCNAPKRYALDRPGRVYRHFGPCVSATPTAALELVEDFHARHPVPSHVLHGPVADYSTLTPPFPEVPRCRGRSPSGVVLR